MKKPLLLAMALLIPCIMAAGDKAPVRVAVIGGMTLGGLWPDLAQQFTHDTGWPVEMVATGSRSVVAQAMQEGAADLVTMHGAEEAADLVANGLATDMKTWAQNEHCIMGPSADPAGIRGLQDGAAALKKIAESKSLIVDSMGQGSREVSRRLWQAAGVEAKGEWILKDESTEAEGVVAFAAAKKAYVIAGRIPIAKGKESSTGMEVMVDGDPAMRRSYVVLVADPKKFPQSNQAGAKALSDWMTGAAGQQFLRDFAIRTTGAPPLFFPVGKTEKKP